MNEDLEVAIALRAFLQRFYDCLHQRVDALFELSDALLTAGTVPSPVHLSLEMVHRRGWGRLYAALNKGEIDDDALRELLASHPLEDNSTKGTLQSMRWTYLPGPAATLRRARSADTTIILPATPRASPL